MATRFRLPASGAGAPEVSPTLQSYTHSAPTTTRSPLPLTDTSTLATVSYAPDAADHLSAGDSLHRQFVSVPMAAGNVFTSGDVLKFAIQCLEANANNNVALQCFVSVVDNAGTTVQATLRSKVSEGTEFATTIQNRFLSTTLDGSYTTIAGDRLVVEFSVVGTPGPAIAGVQGHNASLRWGGSGVGGDNGENDTDTGTTLNPWIEFATTITWLTRVDFFAVGTVAEAASGNVTPALPASWAADDIHICVITSGDNIDVSMPAGWTSLYETNNTAAIRGSIFWRRAVAGDTNPLVTHTAGSTIGARIYGFRNAITTETPIATSAQQANASSVTVTAPTITPRANSDLVVAIAQLANADTSTPLSFGVFSGTNPTFTERGDDESGAGTTEEGFAVDSGYTTSAATGARTSTANAAGVNIGTLIALTLTSGTAAVVAKPSKVGLVMQAVNRAASFFHVLIPVRA